MRVTIYDKNPGSGVDQWFLKLCWAVGCWFQKVVGAVDAYYGASSWADAKDWLLKQKTPITVLQYWGHGSPAIVWSAGHAIPLSEWLSLKPILSPNSLVWFRVCNSFQGTRGQAFSKLLADNLGCTIAGHTRIIGIWQGGLYTRTPGSEPSWSVDEGADFLLSDYLRFWKNHTIFCLRTSIPKGW